MDHNLVVVLLFFFNAVCFCDDNSASGHSEQPEIVNATEGNLESNVPLSNTSNTSESIENSSEGSGDAADSVLSRSLNIRNKKSRWQKHSKSSKKSKRNKEKEKSSKFSATDVSKDNKTYDQKDLNFTLPDNKAQVKSELGELNVSNITVDVTGQSDIKPLDIMQDSKNSSLNYTSFGNRNIHKHKNDSSEKTHAQNLNESSDEDSDTDEEGNSLGEGINKKMQYGDNLQEDNTIGSHFQDKEKDNVDVRSRNSETSWRRKEAQDFENEMRNFENAEKNRGRGSIQGTRRSEGQLGWYGSNFDNGLQDETNNYRTDQMYYFENPNPYARLSNSRSRYIGRNRFSGNMDPIGDDRRFGTERFVPFEDAHQFYRYHTAPRTATKYKPNTRPWGSLRAMPPDPNTNFGKRRYHTDDIANREGWSRFYRFG